MIEALPYVVVAVLSGVIALYEVRCRRLEARNAEFMAMVHAEHVDAQRASQGREAKSAEQSETIGALKAAHLLDERLSDLFDMVNEMHKATLGRAKPKAPEAAGYDEE